MRTTSVVAIVASMLPLSGNATSIGTEARPDALLVVDQHRKAIVERAIASWPGGVTHEQADALRSALWELRADRLLAVSISPGLESLLALLPRAHGEASIAAAPQPKALGDGHQDLVYVPVTPCRIVDTRFGGGGVLQAGIKRDLLGANPGGTFESQGGAASDCGISVRPAAILANITLVNPVGGPHFLVAWPWDKPRPNAATVNWTSPTEQPSNTAAVPLCVASCAADFSLYASNPTNVVVDVLGYFRSASDTTGIALTTNGEPVLRLLHNAISPNVIGGSLANNATAGVRGATIAGGGVTTPDPNFTNEAPNRVTDAYGTIGGGYANRAGNDAGSVVDRPFATVSGGQGNVASGSHAVIGGGEDNVVDAARAVVAGGSNNSVSAGGSYSAIAGGSGNLTSGSNAAIGGGANNTASGTGSSIAGGVNNVATNTRAAVAGGTGNQATGVNAFVGGGASNQARNQYATVSGGIANFAGSPTTGFASTVGGGGNNDALGDYSTIVGGGNNTAAGDYAMVGGGTLNSAAGLYSWAAGRQARVLTGHDGAFVWADSNAKYFDSSAANQFSARATGGVRLVLAIDGSGAATWTCSVANGGSWACSSDRRLKNILRRLDGSEILSRIASLPIYEWTPLQGDDRIRHFGPTAQDFFDAFGLGDSELRIGQQDADGVALAAIQGLDAKIEQRETALQRELAKRDDEIAVLRLRLRALELAVREGAARDAALRD